MSLKVMLKSNAMPTLSNLTLLKTSNLIGGVWVAPVHGKAIDVIDPATNEFIAHLPNITVPNTHEVIHAASHAQLLWHDSTIKERISLLQAWHDLLLVNLDDLAVIITSEQGKPITQSRVEIKQACGYVQQMLDAHSDTSLNSDLDLLLETVITANDSSMTSGAPTEAGVYAAITSSDFPAGVVIKKILISLLSGHALIIKPSTATPLTALAIAQLAMDAKFPAGVINVITSTNREIVKTLIHSSEITRLYFTGSTPAGEQLLQENDELSEKIRFELGTNTPFIVFDDAHIDEAIAGVIQAKFLNAGQACTAASRIYVQTAMYRTFINKLVSAVHALHIGIGTEETTDLGPLVHFFAVEKIERQVRDALSKGGRLVTGGARHFKGKNFYQATVIMDANKDMLLATEEVFGPLVAVFQFDTEAQVIELASQCNHEHPFICYLYSADSKRIERVSRKMEPMLVSVNSTNIEDNQATVFGYQNLKHSDKDR